jgi:hypothetical protein
MRQSVVASRSAAGLLRAPARTKIGYKTVLPQGQSRGAQTAGFPPGVRPSRAISSTAKTGAAAVRRRMPGDKGDNDGNNSNNHSPTLILLSQCTGDTPVEDFCAAAFAASGGHSGDSERRDEVDFWAATLREHWFHNAADVAQLSEQEAARLKIPVRLASVFRESAQRVAVKGGVGGSVQGRGKGDAESVSGAGMAAPAPLRSDHLPERFMTRRGVRVTGKDKLGDYALPRELIAKNRALARDVAQFREWCTKPFYGQLEEPVRDVTFTLYDDIVRLCMGWITRYEPHRAGARKARKPSRTRTPAAAGTGTAVDPLSGGVPDVNEVSAKRLRLARLFPEGSEAGSAELAFAYLQFLRDERRVSANFERKVIAAFVKLAKFTFHDELMDRAGSGASGVPGVKLTYDSLPIVVALRGLGREVSKRGRVAEAVSKQELKWLTWPEYLWVVEQVRAELDTAEREFALSFGDPLQSEVTLPPNASKRRAAKLHSTEFGVAKRYLKFLVMGILSEIPDRQRTLRELAVGRTLVHFHDGDADVWAIQHSAADYKTGSAYGSRPLLPLSKELSTYIDRWLKHWRGVLARRSDSPHDCLLTNTEGAPLKEINVYDLIVSTTYRFTGRRMNPHKVSPT